MNIIGYGVFSDFPAISKSDQFSDAFYEAIFQWSNPYVCHLSRHRVHVISWIGRGAGLCEQWIYFSRFSAHIPSSHSSHANEFILVAYGNNYSIILKLYYSIFLASTSIRVQLMVIMCWRLETLENTRVSIYFFDAVAESWIRSGVVVGSSCTFSS